MEEKKELQTTEDTKVATLQLSEDVERVLVEGNLASLTPEQRVQYFQATCKSLGLNPLTKPFDYIELNGKLTLYAKRDATDQIRKIHGVALTIVSREKIGDVYVVTAQAKMGERTDESTGAVALTEEETVWKKASSGKNYKEKTGRILPLRGDALANAYMKAETKAKRRVTLSIVGLGFLDETEVETIPTARKPPATPEPQKPKSWDEYIVPFGKAKGQMLADLSQEELDSMAAWFTGMDDEPRGQAKELLIALEGYVGAKIR